MRQTQFAEVSSLSSPIESGTTRRMDLLFLPQSRLKEDALLLCRYRELAGLIGAVSKHDLRLAHSLRFSNAVKMDSMGHSRERVTERAVPEGALTEIFDTFKGLRPLMHFPVAAPVIDKLDPAQIRQGGARPSQVQR